MENMAMEGFWTLEFAGIQGWGDGVVTLMAGQAFGGDSTFLYDGTYTDDGVTLNARMHVKRYVSLGIMPIPSVMGREEFDLEITGTLLGNTIQVTGVIPGTQLRLTGTLKRQRDLPTARIGNVAS
jgi:hypothetical protein